jgi:hypothetical protein
MSFRAVDIPPFSSEESSMPPDMDDMEQNHKSPLLRARAKVVEASDQCGAILRALLDDILNIC